MREIFKSERYFTLFDVVVSHGQMLLRSQKGEYSNVNIDVVFFSTKYVQLFTSLRGLVIREVENTEHITLDTVKQYLSFDTSSLFELESNNEKYYVAASFFKVFENQLDFSETSLGFSNNGREKVIATSRV